MAARKVQCPRCQKSIPLNPEFSGGELFCPGCGKKLIITITHRDPGSTTSLLDKSRQPDSNPTTQKKTTVVSAAPSQTTSARPASEDSDERIATVTRQLGIEETARDKGEDEFRIWEPGEMLLGNKYQVCELAPGVPYAEGGVGMVHRVHHLEWDIDFAVKSPKPAFVMSESGKLSFEKECKTWMDLGLHTNVVTCYFFRRIAGIPRVFAEYVADGTLKDWIADGRLYQGTQTEILARILDIAIQFAWGLDHAHSKGLLHLDVKPGNVMMSGDTAKVTDFGLAKALDEGREHSDSDSGGIPSQICDGMTPSYCSPEQYEAFSRFQNDETKTRVSTRSSSGSNHDFIDISNSSDEDLITSADPPVITRQSDIWSWAISVLTMFHGRSPCKKGGQTAAEVFEIFQKLPPSAKRPALPSGMIEILRDCFQKNPADRPESMGIVADRLVRVYEQELKTPYPRTKPSDTASNAESLSNRAISMLDLGKTKEAVRDIRKAIGMCNWHPQITFNATMIDWRFGFISDLQALDRMEELTKHNASDPYSFYALGLLQKERANPRAALPALSKAAELAPEHPEFAKAIKLCQKAASLESRCIGRFLTQAAPGDDTPVVYTNKSEELYLVPAPQNQIRLVSAVLGTVLVEFKRADIKAGAANSVAAISTDYRRELVRLDDGALLLHNKGDSSQKSNTPESQILASLPETERFERIHWGKKQDAHNGTGTLRLSIFGDTVCQFNTATGEKILTMTGHTGDVTSLSISPDGEWGVTGSFDSSLKLWRLRSGRCLRTFRGLAGSVDALWIDSKHRFVLTLVHGSSLQFWNVDLLCNRPRLIIAPLMICMVSSSEEVSQRQSQLETLISGVKESISQKNYAEAVQSLNQAKKIDGWQNIRATLNLPTLIGTHSYATGIDDAASSAMFQAHDDVISSVALSYDGKLAVSTGKDQVIRLWRFPKGELVSEMTAHYDWVRSVDMTIDGHFAVSGSWDKTIRIWDLGSGKMVRKMAEPVKDITCVRFAPDGSTIASSSGWGEITLWNGKTGEKINSAVTGEGNILSIQFSRDGSLLLAGGEKRMTLWNARTLTPIRYFEGFQGKIPTVALSPNRKWGVGADSGGDLLLFDMEAEWKQVPKRLAGHLGEVTSVLFLPDGRRLVSAGKDGTIRFWSIPNGTSEYVLSGKSSGLNSLAANITSSSLLSGGDDAQLRLWSLYWNYDYPGIKAADDEIIQMLRVITAHHRRMAEIQNFQRSPADFYTPGVKLSPSPYTPDDKTILRILNEMAFRGFGNIPRSDLLAQLRSVLSNQ